MVERRGATRAYSVVSDYLGTPREMLDEAGKIAWKAQLDVYGAAQLDVGAVEDCPWRWPGQYEDRETGLRYSRYRYYDAERGGFLSQDPIGLLGGLRPFGYVSDPLTGIDPFGLHTVQGSFYPAGSSTAVPITNPATGNNSWPNVVGSGSNPMSDSGFGREGDSENQLLEHLAATEGQNLEGGTISIVSVISSRGGSLPPCAMCESGMQAFADEFGVNIVYTQMGRRGMPIGDPRVFTPRKEDETCGS